MGSHVLPKMSCSGAYIYKEKKPEAKVQNQKKQWQLKDKDKVVETELVNKDWTVPKKITTASIQVGNIQVLTCNNF